MKKRYCQECANNVVIFELNKDETSTVQETKCLSQSWCSFNFSCTLSYDYHILKYFLELLSMKDTQNF